ncbi:MAG: peroxide stress protein YaaA [Actinobacteria bacterium]|nr:peroxide stress protein YaaA [Actinomycetota bacterium]MCA1721466.1 peroxide stress protein YaaA [Actinomycetota bacterium]
MLVLLPPSEGKAAGGRGRPLELDRLSAPALSATRAHLVQALQDADPEQLQRALACSPDEAAKNVRLTTSGTLPAIRRYTGVVYEALSYATLSAAGRRRANASLRIASALFGLLTPTDPIPAYRLSGGTSVPGLGSLAALWRPVLEPELAAQRGLIVDLRSGPYANLARVPHAVQVRVLRETGGTRSVVSHDNKYTKGLLARALCEKGARSVADVAEAGRAVADVVEVDGGRVDLVLHGLATARQTVSG